MRKFLPDKNLFIGKPLPNHPDYIIKDYVNSGNNGHVFRAYNEKIKQQLACKIVPVENLKEEDKGLWIQEVQKANSIDDPSVVRCFDVVSWPVSDDVPGNFVVFISEYVSGISLKDYIKQAKDGITIGFIEEFLKTILALIYQMVRRKTEHGDLHAGNVIVAEKSDYHIEPREQFRVTDFAVHAITSSNPRGDSDLLQVATILRDLLENVDYQAASGHDKYAYDVLRKELLQRHLIETDPLADEYAKNPKAMFEKLKSIDSEYHAKQSASHQRRLLHPFDYPNCEQIPESNLLNSLYSNQFLGMNEIASRSNLVLTGPRGCGKTMVFRAMSLDHLISINADESENVDQIGIYYRCDDIYFPFARYKHPARPDAGNVVMHFIVVTLLAQMLDTVKKWAMRRFKTEFESREAEVTKELWELLEWEQPKEPGAYQFERFINRIQQKERSRAARKYRVLHNPAEPCNGYSGPEVLLSACKLLRSHFKFLASRPIYFFIDDYSEPKITTDLQENLNRLFMFRSPDCYFKISTESPVSFSTRDIDGKSYVEAREYSLLNLGILYIKDGGKNTLPFLEDLFARRFGEVVGYPVSSLDELIGSFPRNENEWARKSISSSPPHSFYGKETLASLCSGDIYYLIRLIGRMVEENGGPEALKKTSETPKIKSKKQHEVVRAAAGDFIENVRMLPNVGPDLARVVTAFGNVARSYLKFRTSKNETGNPPHQASRIEPYEALQLSANANKILKELLRYSIFLYDPRGKSRRGHVVPRLYLRRYLIPHFNLTFSQRDSVELENKDIELLLTDPKNFEDEKRLRRSDGDSKTADLFDGEEQ